MAPAKEPGAGGNGPPYEWPRRRAATAFRPQFTLYLLYLFVAFVLFALLLILPEMLELLETVPPGPELQERANETAREAARGRLLPAFALALATVGLGSYYRVLPGMREG